MSIFPEANYFDNVYPSVIAAFGGCTFGFSRGCSMIDIHETEFVQKDITMLTMKDNKVDYKIVVAKGRPIPVEDVFIELTVMTDIVDVVLYEERTPLGVYRVQSKMTVGQKIKINISINYLEEIKLVLVNTEGGEELVKINKEIQKKPKEKIKEIVKIRKMFNKFF
ncbi:hypothetical protein EIN_422360 [Entamoeba invadens IP1]|uniref:Uncharacterized protein n=1 Tax=Entamoeba invadens IP1 TaxID=370355 RepID=A0A0A1UFY1_ENTIV|nr:hypothetical protein EIN_422360 [Entamoeba invadens IP1]ELP94275.1 hypothetical protein EIN_422360 [Entamoeba invadens IP1]|eukprot:XP_004261046.1 hypothetical protein EIN_422360 [Entamoeba invadens IP1]